MHARRRQPDDRPHPRGRSGALRRDGKTRTPQYRHADHRPDGYDVAHVADHVGHRTGLPPVYKRRRKINPSDQDTHVDFVDETGEKFEEYNVYHHNFVKWLEANGYDTSKLATSPMRSSTGGWPPRPTTARRPTTSTGWPRSRCRVQSRSGSTTRFRYGQPAEQRLRRHSLRRSTARHGSAAAKG